MSDTLEQKSIEPNLNRKNQVNWHTQVMTDRQLGRFEFEKVKTKLVLEDLVVKRINKNVSKEEDTMTETDVGKYLDSTLTHTHSWLIDWKESLSGRELNNEKNR